MAIPFRLYFLVPGLCALAGSGYLVWEGEQFRANALSAQGEVIDLMKSRDKDGDPIWLPQVEYTTQAGESRTFIEDSNRSIFGYTTGQTVEVLYRADGSEERLDNLSSRWGIPGLLGFMGLLFTGVSVLLRPGSPRPPSDD